MQNKIYARLLFYLFLIQSQLLQFRLKLFNTTLTELHAMAALAIIGLSKIPDNGKIIPAATGMPIKL